MESPRDMLRSQVSSTIARLQAGYIDNQSSAKAALASLRQARNDFYDFPPAAWPMLALPYDHPEKLGDELTEAEKALRATLWLYANHQQGRGKPMHVPHSSDSFTTVGEAAYLLSRLTPGEDDKAVRRNFDAAVTSTTFRELVYHLRKLVGQFGANKHLIPLDYVQLAEDLLDYQLPGRRKAVFLRWNRAYATAEYRYDKKNKDKQSHETPSSKGEE